MINAYDYYYDAVMTFQKQNVLQPSLEQKDAVTVTFQVE